MDDQRGNATGGSRRITARWRRVLICTAAVWCCYAAYALLAVRWIEPPLPVAAATPPPPAAPPVSNAFRDYFAADAWERQQPKFLETEQGTLLFDRCLRLDNGNLRLDRCTVVCFLPGDGEGAPERPVILRAPGGAELMFDAPFDLTKLQFGRLQGGMLRGTVTIDSPPSRPGAQDQLHIQTTNLQINPDRIWAAGDVEFQYGMSQGSGRDLSIYFSPAGARDSTHGHPRVGRIKALELVRVKRFELNLPPDALRVQGSDAAPAQAGETVRVEVRCEGPFLFDFQKAVASLAEKVDVIYHGADGPSDQLGCELLEMHFREDGPSEASGGGLRDEAEPSPDDGVQMHSHPRRIIASGYPAVLRAPSREMVARAERIEFTVDRHHLWLHDRQRVRLQFRDVQVLAPELEYMFDPAGGLGRMWAAGPGSLQGTLGKDRRQVAAEWTEEVRLLPQADSKVLTVKAARRVAVQGVGELSAAELHLFLRELPPEAGSSMPVIELDRLQALGAVQLDSVRLAARLHEARLWFRQSVPAASTASVAPARPAAGPLAAPQAVQPSDPAPSKFQLQADQLHGQVVMGDPPQLERLELRGRIALRELTAADVPAIVIQGEALDLVGGNTPQPIARLVGQPAHASLRGLELVGQDIEVRPADNVVRVAGAGTLNLSLPVQGRTSPPIQLSWQGQMVFDGRTGTFVDGVVARGSHRTARSEGLHFAANGEQLDVTLSRRVDFQQHEAREPVEVREMAFHGWVFLENRLVGVDGRLKSFDQMQLRDLRIDQYTGRLQGQGPGWLVHRGLPTNGTAAALPSSPGGLLQFLRVDFAEQMAGNLHNREVQFRDQVRCLFGMIARWEDELVYRGRESLAERDVLLTSHTLDVAEMSSGSEGDALELRATGNARILGRSFSGNGSRLSYARAKDLLVLEGDGRQDAVLHFQKTPGAAPVELAVGKVLFYPSTKQFALNDIRSFELPQLDQHLRGAARNPAAPTR